MITTNLKTPRAHWYDLPVPAATGIVVFLLFLIGGLMAQLRSAPRVVAVPTPGLIILIASPLPVQPPTAIPDAQVAPLPPNALRRAVVAYDQPNGTALGAIESGRTYQVLARFGAEWLQADVSGSGVVWLRADQVLDLPAGLADLRPTDAPVIVERPIYVAAPIPAVATPEPYTVTNEPLPTLAPQQVVLYDRQQWALDAQRAGR